MRDWLVIRKKLLVLEKLRPELLEDVMKYIEYLIYLEKENHKKSKRYDSNDIKILFDE